MHILRCACSRTSFKGGDAMTTPFFKGGDAMTVLPTLNNSLLISQYFNTFYNFSFSAFFIA